MSEQRAFARGLVDLARVVLSRYVLLGGSQFAAAIAYRALFSLVPLATFAATILAQVLPSRSANRQDVVSAIADQLELSAPGAARLDALITSVPSPWSLAGVAALGLALWGATGVMWSMQKTLAVVFDQGVTGRLIRERLISALLVLGALALVLLAVIGSMLENVAQKVNENVDEALGWQPPGFGVLLGVVAPAAVVFLVVVLLYRYLPHHRPRWLAALYGGAAAAVAHQAVQAGLGWYLSGPADFTQVYGAAGAVFAFLLSVYLSAGAFVICAILTHALDEQQASRLENSVMSASTSDSSEQSGA